MKKMPKFTIVLPAGMHDAIREFLFRDPSREQMGVILAGISESEDEVKFLGRKFIPVDSGEYEHQSYAGLTVRREFSQKLMQLCAKEGLSQIDVHSHPFGPSPDLWFSGTDDRHERIMGSYIYNHLPDSYYASLVMNQGYTRARVWLPDGRSVRAYEIQTLTLVEFPYRKISIGRRERADYEYAPVNGDGNELHARQMLAFGAEGQAKMAEMSVAMIGAGGIGSVMIQGLARLGFHEIVVIDPDSAEVSNLNRVAAMTYADAVAGARKVDIACKSVEAIHPKVRASPICRSVFDPELVPVLKGCDIIVVATDNHATRMYAQRVGVQYLIPVVSVGVNIDVDDAGKIDDISGEYAIALPGENGWCLACAHAYNAETAAYELADPLDQQRWVHRGYMPGTEIKAPSVSHLNGVTANLALTEIHNLISPYKPFKGYVAYDQKQSELMPYTIMRNTECAICSDKALLGLGDIEPIPDYGSAQKQLLQLPPVPALDRKQLDDATEPASLLDPEELTAAKNSVHIASLKSKLAWSNRYDDLLQDNLFNSRFLAAMVVTLPVATLALAIGIQFHHWIWGIESAVCLDFLIAVLFSMLSKTLGWSMRYGYDRLWRGLITHWLLPYDDSYSEQQKDAWRNAVLDQSGVDVPKYIVGSRADDELRQTIHKAVLTIQLNLRIDTRAKSFRRRGIYYEFATNLAEMGRIATFTAAGSLLGAVWAAFHSTCSMRVVVIETFFAILATSFLFLKNRYVRRCAKRHAECFLATVITIAETGGLMQHPSVTLKENQSPGPTAG